jgi:hypothetical protein
MKRRGMHIAYWCESQKDDIDVGGDNIKMNLKEID